MIDLHGRIDLVRCIDCELGSPRDELRTSSAAEPGWLDLTRRKRQTATPTSKAPTFRPSPFLLPALRRRAQARRGVFGESVPRDGSMRPSPLEEADAMLIVGSSLMVYSGFRFVHRAASPGNLSPPSTRPNPRRCAPYAKGRRGMRVALAFLLQPLNRAASGSIQPPGLNSD